MNGLFNKNLPCALSGLLPSRYSSSFKFRNYVCDFLWADVSLVGGWFGVESSLVTVQIHKMNYHVIGYLTNPLNDIEDDWFPKFAARIVSISLKWNVSSLWILPLLRFRTYQFLWVNIWQRRQTWRYVDQLDGSFNSSCRLLCDCGILRYALCKFHQVFFNNDAWMFDQKMTII